MVCDIAVSITQAGVTDEQLKGLLTPALTLAVVKAVLADLGLAGEARLNGDTVVWTNYNTSLTVAAGQATVRSYTGDDQRISAALGAGLAQACDALYGQQIARALAEIAGKQPQIQRNIAVEKEGVVRQATLFTVRY